MQSITEVANLGKLRNFGTNFAKGGYPMPSNRDIAAKLGVSETTVRDWIAHFAQFFSESAQHSGRQREFTQADLDTLATIAAYSSENMGRDAIAEELTKGDRMEYEGTTFGTDARMMPVSTANALIDASEIKQQLQQAQNEIEHLRAKIDAKDEELKRVYKALGAAEARAEMLKELLENKD